MINQIDLIVEFHNLVNPYIENLIPRVGSSIGKDVESYRVQLKKIYMDLNYRKSKPSSTLVDEYIINNGEEILKRGQLSINHIFKNNYMNLIKRSMMNYEVCLVRVDQGNLKKTESVLNVGSIKYLTYNLIENDLYSYIKRVKRKNNNIDIESLIVSYVEKSLLNKDSIEYLKGLISYPFETIKVWDKYLRGKEQLTEDEYIELFSKAKIIDGESIII